MKTSKTKITCFECGSSYSIDLSRLPPTVMEMKCMKCGKQVPILKRMLQPKTDEKPSVETNQTKAPKKEAQTSDFQLYPDHEMEEMGTIHQAEDENSWLACYGDMMSILLIFFILMFAISSVDKKKFETVMESISKSLGGNVTFTHVEAPQAPVKLPPNPLDVFKAQVQTEKDVLSSLRLQLQGFIQENQLQDRFSLKDENEGLVLIAQDMTMFDIGRADIRPEVIDSLKKIGSILRRIKNNIVVEGHTDDLPIHSSRFSSNWELSVMRATNVVHYFVTECGMDPNRLAASGYAYYRPRYALDSTDKEKNRRIEVVIKKKFSDNLVDELLQPH